MTQTNAPIDTEQIIFLHCTKISNLSPKGNKPYFFDGASFVCRVVSTSLASEAVPHRGPWGKPLVTQGLLKLTAF